MDRTDDINEEELTCNPIDTYDELCKFLEDLPPWRSLCKELTPHSEFKISNMEIVKQPVVILEEPETFCHFSPDAEDPVRCEAIKLPKTLVCHDMANGYHDDSYVDGTGDYDAYTFYNWAGIDIFCYFSHHLITIPPVSWINVAHAHGVKVIGTLITEWNEGVKFWEKMLESQAAYEKLADALVALTKGLKFDGWLLNIENKISKPDVLLDFVKHFHFVLHRDIPHAELIWYDSVTVTGNLNWQNGLNQKNRAFFDACDGLFTNYSWTEEDITTSVQEAGERITALYIGIDVWGRNFYGGGQFNTQEAVKLAYEQGCSLAIFAPAWTHEAMVVGKTSSNAVAFPGDLEAFGQFLLRDRALWGSLWPFLHTRLPCQLPFETSFCRGQGKKRRLYGEVVAPRPWYNLRHQQYQPNSAHGPHGYLFSTENVLLSVSRKDLHKDPKGIIRYRHSFVRAAAEAEREEQEREARRDSDDAPVPPTQPAKRSLKSWFMNLLHIKRSGPASAIGDDADAAGPSKADDRRESALEAGTSELTVGSTGRSLVAMSVSLRLGQGRSRSRTRVVLARVASERACLEPHMADSFRGGSCLRVHPSDEASPEHRLTRLLHCDFPCGPALLACVVSKPLATHPGQHLNVKLHVADAAGGTTRVVLVGRDVPAARASVAGAIRTVSPLDPDGARFRELRRHLLLHEHDFYVPLENSFGWIVRYYEVEDLVGGRVTSVNLRTGLPQGPVLLGHFALCAAPARTEPALTGPPPAPPTAAPSLTAPSLTASSLTAPPLSPATSPSEPSIGRDQPRWERR